MRSLQELLTIASERMDRQIADLQAELKQPTASIKQARTDSASQHLCAREWGSKVEMATCERDSSKVLDDFAGAS